jgi:hypothetical protein
MLQTINLKQHPEVAAIIKAAFPSYKKHNAFLREFCPTNINSYWDGGSKDYFALVDLDTMRAVPMPSSTHPFYEVASRGLANKETQVIESDHVGNLTLKVLPENYALVSCGTFCGKPATASIKVNASNLTKFLAA